MAALLVSLAVMMVLTSALLPAWRHAAQREKEAELVFRGEQYARAVALFRAKNGNVFPPSVDVLVQGKYLRKKYIDPMTNGDFEVIGGAQQAQPQGGPAGQRGVPPPGGPGGTPGQNNQSAFGVGGQAPGAATGGIAGVHSKSKGESIRIYKGAATYNQWNFLFSAANRPGSTLPGAVNPGGRGGVATPGLPGSATGIGQGRGTGAGGGRGPGGIGGRGTQGQPPTPPFGSGVGRRGGGA